MIRIFISELFFLPSIAIHDVWIVLIITHYYKDKLWRHMMLDYLLLIIINNPIVFSKDCSSKNIPVISVVFRSESGAHITYIV